MSRLLAPACILVALVATSPAAAADPPTRAEFIAAADKVCASAPGINWDGFRESWKSGRFSVAADYLRRARLTLRAGIRGVAVLPRPAGDGPQIARWLNSKRAEVRIWRRSERAFSNGNPRAGMYFIHARFSQREHSRRIVVSYGFRVCAGRGKA